MTWPKLPDRGGGSGELRLDQIGEKAFLASVLPGLWTDPRFINGFGDDASIIDLGLGKALAFKVDRGPAPIATLRGWSDAKVWGRLAFTAVMSDLLASGCQPAAFMLSANVPGDWPAQDLELIIDEVAAMCRERGVAFLGGDTKESATPNLIGAGIGVVAPESVVGRRGAQPGDALVIAGRIGGFMAAYLLLLAGELSSKERVRALDILARPTARWGEAEAMAQVGGPSASIDLSDGLHDGLLGLTANGLGVEIDLSALPYHDLAWRCSRSLRIPLLNLGLCVGDWSILYAMSEATFRAVQNVARPDMTLMKIGRFSEDPGLLARGSAGLFELNGFSNEHFVARMEDESSYMSRLRTHSPLKPVKAAT